MSLVVSRFAPTAVAICLAGAASAANISVNFEELGARPGDFSLVNALTTEYAGLTFAGPTATYGGAVLNQSGNFGFDARSGQHFLAFNNEIPVDIMLNGGRPYDPEHIIFTDLATDVEIYANGFDCNVRLDALNVAGAIIGSDTKSVDGAWTRLSFSSTTPIQAIIITELTGGKAFCLDDLNYNSAPTPGAISLAAAGLLITRRRR